MFDVGLWLSSMTNAEDQDRMLPILAAPAFANGTDFCSTPVHTLANATATNNTADNMQPARAMAALWQESICMSSTDADINETIRGLLTTDDVLKTLRTAEEVVEVAWLNETMTQQANAGARASTASLTQSILTGGSVELKLRGCLLYRKPRDQWSYMLCRNGSQRDGMWRLHSLEPDERRFDPSASFTMKADQLTSMGRLPASGPNTNEYSHDHVDHQYENGEICPEGNGAEPESTEQTLYSTTVTYDCCHSDNVIPELDQFVLKYNQRWPNCHNIVPNNLDEACFDGESLDWIKQMCDEDFRCTGFSWYNGNGCWKVRLFWEHYASFNRE